MSDIRRCLFLDRDGTINEEVGFLSHPDQLRLLPRAAEVIRDANQLGFFVIVISNQSGVARGLFGEESVHRVNRKLAGLLSANGARVDAFYYCPYHPEEGTSVYRKEAPCRKPDAGMLLLGAREFGISLADSFMIGDRFVDVEAGKRAGCKTGHVLTGYGEQEKEMVLKSRLADAQGRDLSETWELLKEKFVFPTSKKKVF